MKLFDGQSKELNLTFKNPVDYFMDAFNLPKNVAEYIVRNGMYKSVEEAAYSLAGVKTNTINTF